MITILVLTASKGSKGSSTFEFYFGEYFQFIRILVNHCGLSRKNTNKEDCRAKSESEQINQDCRAESESEQNFGPLSTTPPSPRVPPAGLSPPLQLPGPGHCQAGYLLPGKEQKLVNILPSATSWLRLEKISPHLPGNLRSPG